MIIKLFCLLKCIYTFILSASQAIKLQCHQNFMSYEYLLFMFKKLVSKLFLKQIKISWVFLHVIFAINDWNPGLNLHNGIVPEHLSPTSFIHKSFNLWVVKVGVFCMQIIQMNNGTHAYEWLQHWNKHKIVAAKC